MMPKALIVFSTRAGETKAIAELIGEGIRMQGAEAEVVNVTGVKKESDLEGYDAYVFGSATYHGEMMQGMKTLLFLAEKVSLEGKVGGSFGAFVEALLAAPIGACEGTTTYESPSIGRFVTGWDVVPTVNGAPVWLHGYPMLESDWGYSRFGSGEIALAYGDQVHEIWFNQ